MTTEMTTMRRLLALAVFVCLLVATPAFARQRAYGYCEQGGLRAYVNNSPTANPAPTFTPTYWNQSYPSCTVTVYLTGTVTLATLYSDNSSTPLSNPFTASPNGYWRFYASTGRYDVQFSNGGITTPYSIADLQLCDVATEICSTSGGGGGGVTPHNLLSTTHSDTDPYTPPVFGDLVQGTALGKWGRKAGNITATPMFLKSVGNGLVVTFQDWVGVGGLCGAANFVTGINPDLTVNCALPTFTNNVTVASNGTTVATRPTINFNNGGNLTWTITDDVANNRVNITQAVTGGGTGCSLPGVTGAYLYDNGSGSCLGDLSFVNAISPTAPQQVTVQRGGQFFLINPLANSPSQNYTQWLTTPTTWQTHRRSSYGFMDTIDVYDDDAVAQVYTSVFDANLHMDQDNKVGYVFNASATTGNTALNNQQVGGAFFNIASPNPHQTSIGVGTKVLDPNNTGFTVGFWEDGGICSDGQVSCGTNSFKQWVASLEGGKMYLGGDLVLQPEATVAPSGHSQNPMSQVTCDSTQRGRLHYTNSGGGTADVTAICSKNAAGTYAWQPLSAAYSAISGVSAPFTSVTDASPLPLSLGSNYIANFVVAMNHTVSTRALNVTNMVNGGQYNLKLAQDSTGGATLTLGTGCTWVVNNTATTALGLSTVASTVADISWIYDGTYCFVDTTAGGGSGGSSLTFTGAWSSATNYVANNIATYTGSSWIAVAPNSNVIPGTDGGVDWAVLAAAGATGPAGQNGIDGTNGAAGAPGTPGYSPNQVISGCGVSYVSGLTFAVSPCSYIIQNVTYGSPLTSVTLSTADPSLDRIDAIIANTSGVVTIVAGTPSATPAPPAIDISSQLQLTFAYVAAGASTPSNITTTDLYHENTEWTCASTANFNCASTNNPHSGTKDIEATVAVTGNNARLTIPAASVLLNNSTNFVFWIRSKAAWANTRSLTIQWFNGTTAKCTPVTLGNGNFGFSSSLTSAYQQIVIPTSVFACAGIPVTRVQFTVAGSGTNLGFYLDDIILQGGIPSPVASTGLTNCGAWNSTQTYAPNCVVTSGGGSWAALLSNTNSIPAVSNANWQSFGAVAPFITTTASPALTGLLRLANVDRINWRNAGGTADCGIGFDSSNNFTVDPCGATGSEIQMVTEATASATTPPSGSSTFMIETATGLPCGKDSSGVAHCAGTGTVTTVTGTSPVASSGGATPAISINANGITSAYSAVVNNRRACSLQVGDGTNTVVTADYSPFKVASCKVPYAATIVEIDLQSDAGTPSVLLERRRGAATLADLLSGALPAAGTTPTCATSVISTTCIDGTTSSGSITLSNTSLNAGDVIEVKSGTGSTETSTRITIVWTVN